jgi:hypothetical protein
VVREIQSALADISLGVLDEGPIAWPHDGAYSKERDDAPRAVATLSHMRWIMDTNTLLIVLLVVLVLGGGGFGYSRWRR